MSVLTIWFVLVLDSSLGKPAEDVQVILQNQISQAGPEFQDLAFAYAAYIPCSRPNCCSFRD